MLSRWCTPLGVLMLLCWSAARPCEAADGRVTRLQVDEARAAQAGIRKLSAKHLRLFTDLPASAEVDALPAAFDQALPQWCQYFGVETAAHADWWVTGFLMNDASRFRQVGLLPDDLPAFERGFSRAYDLWLYEQRTDYDRDYYRRHLLLHEGTHSFMSTILGGCGPPWYMEGMAELLATHRWRDGRLTLGSIPANREEVPGWGRIKIVVDAVAERRAKTLQQVIEYDARAHLQTEPYGWCWAAALLLDRHPRYQERFRQLRQFVRGRGLSKEFYRLMGDDWGALAEEWQVFVTSLEYGYDVPRTAIDFTPGQPLPESGKTVTVAADRGWQNSGIRLEAGTTYHLRAAGRYQVADQPKTWWCEPNGVSIRYYKGRPLGILLGAVRPDQPAAGTSPLVRPLVIGLDRSLAPKHAGTLFLKINDSAAELGDNAGSLEVTVKPER